MSTMPLNLRAGGGANSSIPAPCTGSRLTFVQNTLENCWTDLAMLDLGSPVVADRCSPECLSCPKSPSAAPTPEDAACVPGRSAIRPSSTSTRPTTFPPDLPSTEPRFGLLTMMFSHPGFYCVVAESGGRIVGSNCLDERSPIAGASDRSRWKPEHRTPAWEEELDGIAANRGVAVEQLVDEVEQPRIGEVILHRREPDQPVEPQVIRTEDARPAIERAGLARQLVRAPGRASRDPRRACLRSRARGAPSPTEPNAPYVLTSCEPIEVACSSPGAST